MLAVLVASSAIRVECATALAWQRRSTDALGMATHDIEMATAVRAEELLALGV